MRRGFTLIELVIASAIGTTMLAVLYSAFTFYTRSISKEDRNLERSRKSQEILGLFREDCSRVAGELAPEELSATGLAAVGFEGSVKDFLLLPRRGVNLIAAYTGYGSSSPYVNHGFGFLEKPDSPAVSSYGKDGPAENLRLKIPPKLGVNGIFHVPIPFDRPLVDYWVLRTTNGVVVDSVLWSFHRTATGRFRVNSLTRHSSALGTLQLGSEGLSAFECRLFSDWSYVDPNPRRPQPVVKRLSSFAQVRVSYDDPPLPVGQPPASGSMANLLIGR